MGKFARWKRNIGGILVTRRFPLRGVVQEDGGIELLGKFGGQQGDINVLEDLPGRDAQNTVGGFDEVIALAAGVLTSESVVEGEAGGELFGFDQKASAIGNPWSGCFHVF